MAVPGCTIKIRNGVVWSAALILGDKTEYFMNVRLAFVAKKDQIQ